MIPENVDGFIRTYVETHLRKLGYDVPPGLVENAFRLEAAAAAELGWDMILVERGSWDDQTGLVEDMEDCNSTAQD